MVIPISREVNCLLLEGTEEPLGIAILPGLAHLRHTDPSQGSLQDLSVGGRGVLDALVRVVDLGSGMGFQRLAQRRQGQSVVQVTSQAPGADRTGEDIQ